EIHRQLQAGIAGGAHTGAESIVVSGGYEDDEEVDNALSPAAITPGVKQVTVLRLVRNTAMARAVKEVYDYRCQMCDLRLDTPVGPYAEGAHIRPLGAPHRGPDTRITYCVCARTTTCSSM